MKTTEDLEQEILSLKQRIERLEKNISAEPLLEHRSGKKISIKEFLMTKKSDNDVKHTLAIAYFLEHFENTPSFNISDIKEGFRFAKIPLPKNINDKINMNIRNGHIMIEKDKKNGKSAWTITSKGEKYIENNFIKEKL